MASASVGESQLKRIIRDLHEAVAELNKEHKECGEPITDDSPNLHKFSYKLEYLLQFDQKEKTTFLGHRKDYWDFFCDCLAKIKGANEGIRFVKSIPELKTSLGKGRALVRYSLVHKRFADTLQQCLINQKVTSDWYYARSPFLKSHLAADIINHLYELNEIHFDVAARGHDLDADWPTFARRTLGANSAHLWRPPSRCSSINSLVSSYSQQAHEFLPIPDFSHGLLGDLGELGEPSPCSVADDLRIQLDQSELRQQELLESVRLLTEEAAGLRGVVKDLQGQLLTTQTAHPKEEPIVEPPSCSEENRDPETTDQDWVGHLDGGQAQKELQVRLRAAEDRNMELLSRLDGALSQRDQQTSSYRHSAGKIQDLLDRLKAVEEERLGAGREAEERGRRAAALARELSQREAALHHAEEKLAELKAAGQEEREATLRRAEEKLAELKAAGQEAHDATLRRAEEKLAELKAAGQEEREATLRRAEELQSAVGRIQGALSLKEKESGNLRAQLQALQASLEARERQAEELRRRLQEEREEVLLQRSSGGHKEEAAEKELRIVKERLEVTERELSERSQRVQELEEQEQRLAKENRGMCSSVSWTGASTQEQAKKLEDYKSQCASMMALNAKLLQTVKRSEESTRELMDAKLDLQKQLATLRASEKPLPSRLEAGQPGLEEGERGLEESQDTVGPEAQEAKLRRLEQDKQALQEQLIEAQARAEELQISLQASRGQQADLSDRLRDAEAELRERIQMCQLLQNRVEELEGRGEEKGSEESSYSEKLPRDGEEAVASRLMLAEAQRDLSRREEARLQAEVVALRAELLAGEEERGRSRALQEVTEASREDLSIRAEELKAQVEQLNRGQVEELLGAQQREEALVRERDEEAHARAALAEEVVAAREELQALRRRYDALALEHSETREALGRANTETAQLGVAVCQLSAQNQEAGRRLAAGPDTQEEPELRRVHESHQENPRLHEKVARGRGEALKETDEELQALKFQLSSQAMEQQNQLKAVNGQLQEVKSQLEGEQEKVVIMETRVKELERENHGYTQEMEEKNSQLATFQEVIRQSSEELSQLKKDLTRSQQSVVEAQKTSQQLAQRLHLTTLDKQNSDLRMSAELDDLYRTKVNLEERLIELIREKDALWQKSDALEFEQKLRDEETERDGSHCLGCQSPFSWWLRKHNCRLCGRAFCYYCCSSTVTVSLQQGGARERCCRDCYEQHSAVVERHPQDDTATAEDRPCGPPPQPGAEEAKPDDGVFDIITEEEVNGVYDSDSLSFSTACSPGHSQQGAAELNSSASAGDTASEDAEDVSASVQDAEICLLRAGELTLAVPFSLDDITAFGDSSRELFIKSSCYSIIPIAVGNAGPTIGWVFTSDPKSISFSVVYREDTDTPLEQATVLIPLTRCNSHRETIQGELKVRNPGEYTLIFDNSFSRFISKKVLYRLSVEKPVIYDGSDNAETL